MATLCAKKASPAYTDCAHQDWKVSTPMGTGKGRKHTLTIDPTKIDEDCEKVEILIFRAPGDCCNGMSSNCCASFCISPDKIAKLPMMLLQALQMSGCLGGCAKLVSGKIEFVPDTMADVVITATPAGLLTDAIAAAPAPGTVSMPPTAGYAAALGSDGKSYVLADATHPAIGIFWDDSANCVGCGLMVRTRGNLAIELDKAAIAGGVLMYRSAPNGDGYTGSFLVDTVANAPADYVVFADAKLIEVSGKNATVVL
jgi:hypothetical protein